MKETDEKSKTFDCSERKEDLCFRFDFYDDNLETQIIALSEFVKKQISDRKDILLLKRFPPCITERIKSFDFVLQTILIPRYGSLVISRTKTILSNNFYYGPEYKRMNKKLSASPFLSVNCKSCSYFNDHSCRGMFNSTFFKDKSLFESKYSKESYDAIKSDYENGNFAFGSMCKSSCSFCLNRSVPDSIMRFIPSLSVKEILHFLHYSPDFLSIAGTSYHCKLGELLDRSDRDEIFARVLNNFMNDAPNMIVTNGRNIDEKFISNLLSLGLKDRIFISISVNSLNEELRKRFSLPDVDCLQKMKLLKSNNISFGASIVPMKSMIDSGDIFNTIDKILALDSSTTLRIHPSNPHNFLDEDIRREFEFDFEYLKKRLLERYPEKNLFFLDDSYMDVRKIDSVLADIKEFSDDSTVLVMCPEKTFDIFKRISSERIKVVKIISTNGYKDASSGILTFKDYESAIMRDSFNDFSGILVIPRASFDLDLNDFTMGNMNSFWNEINKNKSIAESRDFKLILL